MLKPLKNPIQKNYCHNKETYLCLEGNIFSLLFPATENNAYIFSLNQIKWIVPILQVQHSQLEQDSSWLDKVNVVKSGSFSRNFVIFYNIYSVKSK